MDKNLNPDSENNENQTEEEITDPQEETLHQHASTTQPDIHTPHQANMEQSSNQQETKSRNKINFDFGKSMNESKSIVKDAVFRPHSLIVSNRSISIETSVIIFVILTILVGVSAYFSVKNFMDNAFGGFGSLFGPSIGIDFLFLTMLGWLATFAIGYFSLYFMLSYFGNRKMDHQLLLTKYAIVNIPFVLVFCLIFTLFGFVLIDFFLIMYVFGLMLFGMIHIYLFLMNVDKPKYDLFWLSSGYLLVLLVATYFITGIDFGLF